MTHNPHLRSSVAHMPTVEQIMNGNNPFEILNTPLGKMERWRAEAMLIGTTSGVQNVYRTIRDDAAAQAARADATEALATLVKHVCDQIAEFERRFDAHVARLAEAKDARRADQEREAEFNEEPLELPPDISEKQTLTQPAKIGDTDPDPEPDTHQPGGELHTITAKDEEPASELPEPPLETEDAGGVPLSYGKVPTSYVHSEDQAEFAIPEPQMTTDARRRKPRGGVVPQPVSVSLNEG